MSPDLLEPPAQQAVQQAPVTQQGDLRSMLDSAAADTTHADDTFKAETPEKVAQQASQKTEKPQSTKKPEAKPDQKVADKPKLDGKFKGKWQGLEALKNLKADEEPTEAEVAPEGQVSQETGTEEEPQSPQARRWSELRKTEDDYKALTAVHESLKKEVSDLRGKPQIPEEVQKRLDHLEQLYAVEMLDQKPDFQQDVIAPLQEQLDELGRAANHAGLDANQRQALRAAAEDSDSFTRIRSIKQIIGASTKIEDPEEISSLIQFAVEHAGKYQDAKKIEQKYVRDAANIANSVRGKEAQATEQEKKRSEAEYNTAHEEMIGTLKGPLSALFDDPVFGPTLQESLKGIRPAETAMDRAYQAQAGEILPFSVKVINKLMAEVSTLRKSLQAREAAKPKTTDGTTPAAEQGQQQPNLKHLLGALR